MTTPQTSAQSQDNPDAFAMLHSSRAPYCLDTTCRCHTSWHYHEHVIRPHCNDEELAKALAFFGIEGRTDGHASCPC
jgi:hypothetical protein